MVTFPVPIPDEEKKGFMKALKPFKVFIKDFEAPQRSVKIKI